MKKQLLNSLSSATKTLILVAMLFFVVLSSTQAQPSIQWQKCLGGTSFDAGSQMIQTADNGYAVVGTTNSLDGDVTGFHGNVDFWVVKLDSVGAIQWQKCLGGSNGDYGGSIIQTNDGGYVVAGQTNSNDGDVSGYHGGGNDFWVVKLDSLGAIQWQKCLGGTLIDQSFSLTQTSDGGYAVAGQTNSNDGDVTGNHGNNDFWVVKLDSLGTIQWQKCLGGSGDEYATSIIQTIDDGYAVTGYTNSNDGDVSGNHGGGNDCWVVKLDSLGAIQWQKCLGGSLVERAYSIIQTSESGYVLLGETYSNDGDVTGNHGGGDCWVVKLDSLGAIQWQKCLGGTAYDDPTSIAQTSDGGYIMVGGVISNDGDVSGNHGAYDYWVVKLDSLGAIQWQKCLGGTSIDIAMSIILTNDNRYAISGYTDSNNGDVTGNHGSRDYWVVKLGSDVATEIETVQKSHVTVYPNPFINELNINVGYNPADIIVTDLIGKVVRQTTSVGHTVLDMVNVPSGVYFLKITSENKSPVTIKVLAQ